MIRFAWITGLYESLAERVAVKPGEMCAQFPLSISYLSHAFQAQAANKKTWKLFSPTRLYAQAVNSSEQMTHKSVLF